MSRKGKHDENKKKEQDNQTENEMAELIKELEKKDAVIKDYLATMQLLQADFENYKKRVEKERASTTDSAKESVFVKLLDVVDNFERALSLLPDDSEKTDFVKGIEMIYGQLKRLLDEECVTAIDCLNKEFDPYLHEALMMDNSSSGTVDVVCDELQKGYMHKEKVIRHSKVKVKKSEKTTEGE